MFFLKEFWLEISAFYQTWDDINRNKVSPETVIEIAIEHFSQNPRRLAGVLATCTDASVGLLEGQKKFRDEVIRELIGIADIPEVMASLNFAPSEPGPAPRPSATEKMIDQVAIRYGLTPLEIMGWPYLAMCSVVEIIVWECTPPEKRMASGSNLPESVPAHELARMLDESQGRGQFRG